MNKLLKVVLSVAIVIAIGGAYVFPSVQTYLGSVVGPELLSPFFSVDGVKHEYRKAKFNTATTTPCALKSPAATSTLAFASAQVTTASSTATTWTLAKATTAFATTTLLNTFSLGSGVLGTMVATSTTVVAVDDQTVIAPNQYLVWGVAGTAVSDVTKLNGVCQAEFIVTSFN